MRYGSCKFLGFPKYWNIKYFLSLQRFTVSKKVIYEIISAQAGASSKNVNETSGSFFDLVTLWPFLDPVTFQICPILKILIFSIRDVLSMLLIVVCDLVGISDLLTSNWGQQCGHDLTWKWHLPRTSRIIGNMGVIWKLTSRRIHWWCFWVGMGRVKVTLGQWPNTALCSLKVAYFICLVSPVISIQ